MDPPAAAAPVAKRCFVFIKGIPSNFTDDKLKAVLRDQTDQAMRCVVLPQNVGGVDDNGDCYGLALYANERAALLAAKQGVSLDDGDTRWLTLQAMRTAKTRGVESIFSDSINVDGEEIDKKLLAPSRGLQDVYRGKGQPRWCEKTKEKSDCEMGTACRFLHLLEYQTTTRRRREVEFDEDGCGPDAVFHRTEYLKAIFPQEVLQTDTEVVPVSVGGMVVLRGGSAAGAGSEEEQHFIQQLKTAVETVVAAAPTKKAFVRLNLSQTAPTDAPFYNRNGRNRLDATKAKNPLPLSGLPTPQKRDRYCAKLWKYTQQQLAVTSAEEAITLLQDSVRVQSAIGSAHSGQCKKGSNTAGFSVVVSPWLDIPSPFHCVRLFLVGGDAYCAIQKDDYLLNTNVESDAAAAAATAAKNDSALRTVVSAIDSHVKGASFCDRLSRSLGGAACSRSALGEVVDTYCVDVLVTTASVGGSGTLPPAAVVTSIHDFGDAAAANGLFPQEEPVGLLTTRLRQRKSCETQHLPREWLHIIPH